MGNIYKIKCNRLFLTAFSYLKVENMKAKVKKMHNLRSMNEISKHQSMTYFCASYLITRLTDNTFIIPLFFVLDATAASADKEKKKTTLPPAKKPRLPESVTVELQPKTNTAWQRMSDISHNPNLRVKVKCEQSLSTLIETLERKWVPSTARFVSFSIKTIHKAVCCDFFASFLKIFNNYHCVNLC